MTFLGPLHRLHFWHVISSGRGNHGHTRGKAERRETEIVDAETKGDCESRYVFHPFKSEAME
jgi:hypothetical protein